MTQQGCDPHSEHNTTQGHPAEQAPSAPMPADPSTDPTIAPGTVQTQRARGVQQL